MESFVEEITVDKEKMTIYYFLPMLPNRLREEVIGVLPFVQFGEAHRTRTCNRLIKSQLLYLLS